jgi:hypothetical protein
LVAADRRAASADFRRRRPCHNQNMTRLPRDIVIGFLLLCAVGWT